MRCPDCNKFVSFDEMQVEEDSVSVSGEDGQIIVAVAARGVLCCAECGGELKEHLFEIDMDAEHVCDSPPCATCGHDRDLHWKGQSECQEIMPGKEENENDTPCACMKYTPGVPVWDNAEFSFDYAPTDRYEDKDRHGKKITNYRYMKHYYGVEVSGAVTCPVCEAEIEMSGEAEEQGSGFDELV